MISYEEAKYLINKNVKQLPVSKIELLKSAGFVLATDIHTKTEIPAFDSSAVDGFAVKLEDFKELSYSKNIKLKIQNTIQAGDLNRYTLKKNHTFKIFTGALVPQNVDAIIKKEDVEEKSDSVYISKLPVDGANIRKAGEEFAKGDLVLKKGTLITPPVIGLLASLGISKVNVIQKPKVSVIVTGNELRNYNQSIKKGQIRDSNAPALISALNLMGINPVLVKIVKDDMNLIKKAIREAEKVSDIIITAGGVSVGEYDYVKDACKELGFKEIYWQIAIKPGKPNYFAIKGNKVLFGLPGNPVAVLVSFHNLVKYAIKKMMGVKSDNITIKKATLLNELRKKEGRFEFVRGVLKLDSKSRYVVSSTKGQDSHMVGGIAQANCLIYFPVNKNFLPAGSEVEITLLDWFNI